MRRLRVHPVLAMLAALAWSAAPAQTPPAELSSPASQASSPAQAAQALVAAARESAQPGPLLDQADAILAQAASTMPEGSADRLAIEVQGLDVGLARLSPAADRLAWLMGTAADRAAMGAPAGELADRCDRLAAQVQSALEQGRRDLRLLVTDVPQLEQLQEQVRYKAAWAHYYAAMGCRADAGKHLRAAMEAIAPFAQQEGQIAGWSRLLAGQCHRRLGHADQARTDLSAAVSSGPAPAAVAARFEMAMLETDAACDEAAMEPACEAIDAFASAARAAGESAVEVDLKTALLKQRWFGRLGELASDEPTRQRRRTEAGRALLEALSRPADPAQIDPVLEILAWRESAVPAEGTTQAAPTSLELLLSAVRTGGANPSGAQAALEAVLAASDGLAGQTHPLALWRLGEWLQSQGRPQDAAAAWLRLSREFPSWPAAWAGAQHATDVLERQMQSAGGAVPADLRRRYAQAIRQLLAADPARAGQWAYELGCQYEQLAAGADSPAQASEYLDQALGAYERAPAGPDEPSPAATAALVLRARRLLDGAGADRAAAAALAAELNEQARLADAAGSAASKPAADTAWYREQAAGALFWSARLTHQVLGEPQPAAEVMASLASRYPRTQGARLGAEFRVQLLLEKGQVAPALGLAREFAQTDPASGGAMLQQLWPHIRRRLDDRWLLPDPTTQPADGLGGDYLALVQPLYDGQAQEPIAARYALTQAMAEALLEAGQPERAMELFEQCRQCDGAAQAASASSTHPASVDGRNLSGLARANRAMGRYSPALAYYRQLGDGLEAAGGPAYWRTELEYGWCVVQAARADAQAMRRLVVRVRQLRLVDPAMGGLAGPFDVLEQRAQALAGN